MDEPVRSPDNVCSTVLCKPVKFVTVVLLLLLLMVIRDIHFAVMLWVRCTVNIRHVCDSYIVAISISNMFLVKWSVAQQDSEHADRFIGLQVSLRKPV